MTRNQIDYWKMQEDMRANRAKEDLTKSEQAIKSQDVAVKQSTLEEAQRHNKAMETEQAAQTKARWLEADNKRWTNTMGPLGTIISGFFK